MGSEPWQAATLNDGTAGAGIPHQLCYWTPYSPGSGFSDPGYFRDPAGVVHLRGLVVANDGSGLNSLNCQASGDTGRIIFQLPEGYRPETLWIAAALANEKAARVDVDAVNGAVQIGASVPDADKKVWVSLDNISFRCAPSGQHGCP